jgi:hypothetical protein
MPFWRGSRLIVASPQFAGKNLAAELFNIALQRRLCSGRLLRPALLTLLLANTLTNTRAIAPQTPKKASTHRANELTLAGLRPGRDSFAKAIHLYGKATATKEDGDEASWQEHCGIRKLITEKDKQARIQTVRVIFEGSARGPCGLPQSGEDPWRTGRGLHMFDPTARLDELYGPPDSKSPSTRDGQPLELWYYAFDWAGPDVPQVMEVLCTTEKDGQPGRVIEITLAAPSL